METLQESSRFEYLTPKMDAEGNLFCIRRPYKTGREVTAGGLLKDIVFFPYRLLRAVFHFLNFFSMIYSGKRLSTQGGDAKQADPMQMTVWGNLIKAQQEGRPEEDAPALVDKSWELIRVDENGGTEVLEDAVLCFDLADDGTPVFSNGSGVFALEKDGKRKRLFVDGMIQQIAVLRSEGREPEASANRSVPV